MTTPQVTAWSLEPVLLSDDRALERRPDAGRVFSVSGLGAHGPGCAQYRVRVPPVETLR